MVVPALLAVAVLIGGGVFAAVNVSQHRNNKPTTAAAPTTPPPNTGPFTGTYTANFDPRTYLDGQTGGGCGAGNRNLGGPLGVPPGGCVATASRRSGDNTAC